MLAFFVLDILPIKELFTIKFSRYKEVLIKDNFSTDRPIAEKHGWVSLKVKKIFSRLALYSKKKIKEISELVSMKLGMYRGVST